MLGARSAPGKNGYFGLSRLHILEKFLIPSARILDRQLKHSAHKCVLLMLLPKPTQLYHVQCPSWLPLLLSLESPGSTTYDSASNYSTPYLLTFLPLSPGPALRVSPHCSPHTAHRAQAAANALRAARRSADLDRLR